MVAVAPGPIAGWFEAEACVMVTLGSGVVSTRLISPDWRPTFLSVTVSWSVSFGSAYPSPPPSLIVYPARRSSVWVETRRSNEAVSAPSCTPAMFQMRIPVSEPLHDRELGSVDSVTLRFKSVPGKKSAGSP